MCVNLLNGLDMMLLLWLWISCYSLS